MDINPIFEQRRTVHEFKKEKVKKSKKQSQYKKRKKKKRKKQIQKKNLRKFFKSSPICSRSLKMTQ